MMIALVLTQITMNAIRKRAIILVNIWKKDKFYSYTVIVTVLMKRIITEVVVVELWLKLV